MSPCPVLQIAASRSQVPSSFLQVLCLSIGETLSQERNGMHDEMKGVKGEMQPDYPSMELGKASTGLVAVLVARGSDGADGWKVV